ncbi:MAG TPA: clostripain-related cysteine peptidase, partial [Anaerolineae bacterium]|nr:clostripain-related cysteine peptidase [Anaerolineae bacterium]
MRRIQFVATSLIVFVLVASMTGSAFAAPPAPQAKWTVMVYISGDNDLENYVVSDIESELAPTGSSPDVQVVALADRGPGYDTSYGDWQTTKLFHVTQGMKADAASAVADWGERDMGDPRTLTDFVSWSKANYPANHYALIFWGHGWNWHPGFVMRDDTDHDTLDYEELKPILPALGFMDMVG